MDSNVLNKVLIFKTEKNKDEVSLDKEFRDKSWLVSIVTLECNPSAEQGRRPAGGGVAK